MINTIDDLLRLATENGCSEPEKCREVLQRASFAQRSPVAALLDSQLVREPDFLKNLAAELDIPWREESEVTPIEQVREKFPARLALGQLVIPESAIEGGEMRLLTFDPLDYAAWQAITQHWRGPVRPVMTTRRRLLETLKSTYGVGADTFEELLEGREDDLPGGVQEEIHEVGEDDSEASVMKFVNQILREGLHQGATDIHFEPLGHDLRIRYRIDGVLHEAPVPQRIKMLQDSVISRLKIMSGLDIAERRRPQDGRIALEIAGQPIDVRVATIPCVYGENVSLRLLGQQRFDFSTLGLDPANEKRIRNLIASPNGIILVTGPTGCGKSTSLYTFLSSLNVKERRIVTIEDPVENKLDGVIQIAVKPEIDLTFATALRSILRGDPNVVMVGEMRDLETTEIAIRAALTGHLVFSTLHTNDAVGGITRLLDMGVEPFLVGSSVRAFIAQRLVRRLCPHCSQPGKYSPERLAEIGFPIEWTDKIRRPVGCDKCRNSGYSGRTALFEICMMSTRLQELIQRRAPASELRDLAIREGMVPLRKDGWNRIAQGVTSIEEVLRVTASELEVLDE
ncbi:MAG: type II/IV secretion system protein [Verrucomicrobia bacterium]|nr:type II/IV secretion system protein [Verrucomicrobiota bacterium]